MSIEIIQGDITKIQVDAIVNAANSSLLGGDGVDGAIHRAGGSAILEECQKIRAKQGRCATGEAVITTAGRLPAKYVIHTVGPVWQGGQKGEAELLSSCYRKSLELAVKNDARSVAFPSISTGIYGYPINQASHVALGTVRDFLEKDSRLERIIIVCFSQGDYQTYLGAYKDMQL